MSTNGIAKYYADRKREAIALSRAATDRDIRKIYLDFAREYAGVAGQFSQGRGSCLYVLASAGESS